MTYYWGITDVSQDMVQKSVLFIRLTICLVLSFLVKTNGADIKDWKQYLSAKFLIIQKFSPRSLEEPCGSRDYQPLEKLRRLMSEETNQWLQQSFPKKLIDNMTNWQGRFETIWKKSISYIYKNRDHMISKYWSLQLSQEKIDLNSKLWYYGSEIIFDIYIQ